MNLTQIIGKKVDQTQGFLENGHRVPMSSVMVSGNVVCQIKTTEKDGYNALQIGFETKRAATKAIQGHSKKAGLERTPRFFREIRVDETPDFELGSILDVATILEAGDVVNVTGTSKGKGFAGAVKRWNFRGGPRTHGQSNRERAPGSSGSGTTPGRVYKGKKRAGHMGVDTVTVRNLEVLEIKDGVVVLKGLIPGVKGAVVTITRVGKNKKHLPMYKTEEEKAALEAEMKTEEVATPQEEVVEAKVTEEVQPEADQPEVEKAEEQVEVVEEKPEEEKVEEKTEDKTEEK